MTVSVEPAGSRCHQGIASMWAEGPGGGHYDNMMNPRYRRVGIGLYQAAGRFYLTNDFSD